MNAKFFTPNDIPKDILKLWENSLRLRESINRGSTKELSQCWANARGFPSVVKDAFNQSGFSALENLEFKRGYPVHKVKIEGGGQLPKSDIYVCASGDEGPVCIIVEGKVSENFEELVQKWLGGNPSDNKQDRLSGLLHTTGLDIATVQDLRYQLLHRTAAALIKAKGKPGCKTAVMLVHSFSRMRKNFRDFAAFANVMGAKINPDAPEDCILRANPVRGINLYLGWVTG